MFVTKNTPFGGITRVDVPCVPHVCCHALENAYHQFKLESYQFVENYQITIEIATIKIPL